MNFLNKNKLRTQFDMLMLSALFGVVPALCYFLVAQKNISFIDMLHSDIQGFEYDMLTGASEMIQKDKIGYYFISTHSNEIHEACKNYLIKQNYIIVASYNLSEAYSDDGLIVAKSKSYKGLEQIQISLKQKIQS